MDLTDCRGFLLNHFHIIASLSFNLRLDGIENCVHGQWFLSQCSEVTVDIWYISILGIQYGFFACTEISSDFHNLFMIFCNIDDDIFKFFEIVHWGTLFWNLKICLFLFIYLFCRFLNHCQFSLLRNAASQRCSFFTTKHVIDLLPVNLISLQLFLFCTAHFSCSFFFF